MNSNRLKAKVIKAQLEPGQNVLWLNNKRMLCETSLIKIPGVEIVISTIGGYEDSRRRIQYWTGFFVAYSERPETQGEVLWNTIHDVGLISVRDNGKKGWENRLFSILKDHRNNSVKVRPK